MWQALEAGYANHVRVLLLEALGRVLCYVHHVPESVSRPELGPGSESEPASGPVAASGMKSGAVSGAAVSGTGTEFWWLVERGSVERLTDACCVSVSVNTHSSHDLSAYKLKMLLI